MLKFVCDAGTLSPEQVGRLVTLIKVHKKAMGELLGSTAKCEHVIDVTDPPVKQGYYRVSPVMQQLIDQELDDMLRKGIAEKSNSSWSSPILLIKKEPGSYRFCVDYRKLNAVTKRDSYPLPMMQDILDTLMSKSAHFISTIDLKFAYWQIPVASFSLINTQPKYASFISSVDVAVESWHVVAVTFEMTKL